MTNVTPQQAQSNLSLWFTNPPLWMLAPQIDEVGELFFLTLAIVMIISSIWPWFSARMARRSLKSPATTKNQGTDDALVVGTGELAVTKDAIPSGAPSGGNGFRQWLKSISPIVPDWTIRDLFFHICPDLKQRQTDDTIGKIGNEVGDKLATGQLRSWGRINRDNGTRALLSEIDKEYWKYAEFTFFFLSNEDGARYLVHATARDGCKFMGIAQYRDIQVNKAQALTIWPESGTNTTQHQEAQFDAAFEVASLSKDSALLKLVKLRTEGVGIRNESQLLTFTSDLDVWSSKVRRWMNEVIETIKPVSEADSEWFATLGEIPTPRVPIPNIRLGGDADRMMFIKTFREHDFRLKRLDDLLRKHGVGA